MWDLTLWIDGTDPSSTYNTTWAPDREDEFGDEDGGENHSTGQSPSLISHRFEDDLTNINWHQA